jgi:hypothetical protein
MMLGMTNINPDHLRSLPNAAFSKSSAGTTQPGRRRKPLPLNVNQEDLPIPALIDPKAPLVRSFSARPTS